MDKKQICIKFAREICEILDISVPAIKFVSADRMRTSTQIAALTPDAILIRNDMTVSPELFFAIAHELRHSYQIANGADLKAWNDSKEVGHNQGGECICIYFQRLEIVLLIAYYVRLLWNRSTLSESAGIRPERNKQPYGTDTKRIRVNTNKPIPRKSVLALFLQNINRRPVRNMLQQLHLVRDLNIR